MIRLLVLLLGLSIGVAHAATPATTMAPSTLTTTQCTSSQFVLGNGAGNPSTCSALAYGLMPSVSANSVLGALTATTPSALAIPSCSGANQALNWTSGTGFGCVTIAGGGGGNPTGTVNLATFAGVTVGTGQTLLVRQNNCTNINAAISFAETNGLELDVPAGTYEINCVGGIVIPATGITSKGFKWRGSRLGSLIVQYYATSPGGPALTIGDITGGTISYGLDFDGASVSYGASQTGFTSAETVQIGAMANGRITGMFIGSCCSNPNPGYDGVLFANGGTLLFANNSVADLYVSGAQRTLFNATNALGQSDVFSNITLRNGSTTPSALTGYCLTLGTTTTTEPKFTGLDCLEISGNVIVDIQNAIGAKIDNLHLQGIQSTGANPVLVQTSGADVKIGSMQVQDWVVKAANLSGTPKVFRDASATASNLVVSSLNFLNTVSSNVNTPFTVMAPDAPANDNGAYSINEIRFQDTVGTTYAGNVNLDSHMPTTSSTFCTPERVGQYTWGPMGSAVDKAVIPITATYTHYGQLTGSTIEVPASITSFTLTLAATQGATGTAPVGLGTTVHVRRQSGSAAGTLTIVDDAATTLATSTTAAVDYWFIFNGTHFVSYTPVT